VTLLLLLACSTPESSSKDRVKPVDSAADTDTDTDADADTDTDTDTDTDPRDSGSVPDLGTFQGFVLAHARMLCTSRETCGYLDDQGYADERACVAGVEAFFDGVSCPDYQQEIGEACISEDRRMSRACDDFAAGAEPRVCGQVCDPPK
jgi:hypothetical protein